jgi:predicted dehydrogenase
VIGAGNYAARTLLPALEELGVAPAVIAAPGGVSAALSARTFKAARATSDVEEAIAASDVDAVMILTRHDSHADLVVKALAAGKHVFVEKPLCTTRADLARISAAASKSERLVAVGFNRRWAPHVRHAMELLRDTSGPRTSILTVNAGTIPASHWTQDSDVGAGRIVGEACHFVDLARFLAGSKIIATRASSVRNHEDTRSITLEHEDGSVSTILYISTGHPRFPKERIEVFASGRIVAIDNYRRLHAHGWSLRSGAISLRQDKGQTDMMKAFLAALREGGPAPIPFDELVETMTATFDAAGVTS